MTYYNLKKNNLISLQHPQGFFAFQFNKNEPSVKTRFLQEQSYLAREVSLLQYYNVCNK